LTVTKYSKPAGPLIAAKTDFFDSNAALLDKAKAINAQYAAQPARTACKTCGAALAAPDFISFGVGYAICGACGHLNGLHEDTQAFVDALYADEGGANYKDAYLKNYDQRVRDIYLPKADFLLEVLEAEDWRAPVAVTDMGCGGGHFVRACELREVSAKGFDPSADLIALGSEMLERNALTRIDMTEFESVIADTDAPVVSLIGVLEHLREPVKALEAFQRSEARYLYISVPLFSFSALLEHAHPGVFPRQLSGGHTHLYTKESLGWLARRHGFRTAGAWWFGTDMVDLYRTLIVSSQAPASEDLREAIMTRVGGHLDALQAVLDEAEDCSEVHMVWAKDEA